MTPKNFYVIRLSKLVFAFYILYDSVCFVCYLFGIVWHTCPFLCLCVSYILFVFILYTVLLRYVGVLVLIY